VAKEWYAAVQKASRETRLLTVDEVEEIDFAVRNPEIARQREEEEARRLEEEARAEVMMLCWCGSCWITVGRLKLERLKRGPEGS